MKKKVVRYIYIILGTISLCLGLLGIVTPGLPTTPFLLLTAFLYAKSSPQLHRKLVEHKITGSYINRVNRGLSMKATLFSICFMWVMISVTVFVVFSETPKMQFIMVLLGMIGTVAQFIVLRKRKGKNKQESVTVEEEK